MFSFVRMVKGCLLRVWRRITAPCEELSLAREDEELCHFDMRLRALGALVHANAAYLTGNKRAERRFLERSRRYLEKADTGVDTGVDDTGVDTDTEGGL